MKRTVSAHLSSYTLMVVLFLCGCASQPKTTANIDPTENSWKRVQTHGFSFSIPPTLIKTEGGMGTDAYTEEYESEDIHLGLEVSPYQDDFSRWPPETKFEKVKIDGIAATVGTVKKENYEHFAYRTEILIGDGLSMFAACKSEKEVAIARRIFESISFNKTGSGSANRH